MYCAKWSKQPWYDAAEFRSLLMPFLLLVKVKLSLLLLYDGKTVVFSGEHGSLSAFWYICMGKGRKENGVGDKYSKYKHE